jgi:hypothetical protein
MCRFSIEVVAINGSPYGRAGETFLADNPIAGAVEFLSFESPPATQATISYVNRRFPAGWYCRR